MNYRQFGRTDMMVSETGFGAWAIGGAAQVGTVQIGWGRSDDNESVSALETAAAEGINFFDTADFYGLGHSEELIGKVFANSEKVLIATKVGQKPGTEKPVDIDYSASYILQACEASLRRLRRECIDYYQLHVANISHLREGSCIEAMQRLQQTGKIRYWGISLSTYNPFPEAEFILDNQLGHGFQLVFNIINQKVLPLIKRMHEQGFGIIARMPLQFGLLTGKFKRDTQFDETDHRNSRLTPEIIERANHLLEDVWRIADRNELSKTMLALSFILSHPEVSLVIPGIRSVAQAVENSRPFTSLNNQDLQSLYDSYDNGFSSLLQTMQQQG